MNGFPNPSQRCWTGGYMSKPCESIKMLGIHRGGRGGLSEGFKRRRGCYFTRIGSAHTAGDGRLMPAAGSMRRVRVLALVTSREMLVASSKLVRGGER